MSEVPSTAPSFEEVVRERINRRGALKAMLVLGGGAAGVALMADQASAAPFVPGELTYDAIALNTTDAITTPANFKHDVLISWGDPVVPGTPGFDIDAQTPAKQAGQFGFNNDYTDYRPLPYVPYGSPSAASDHGLLFVNHEYTSANMMFPGLAVYPAPFTSGPVTSSDQKLIEIEAHGASVIEVELDSATNTWSYDPASTYNRRITGSTPITISGPAAGNVHLRTNADPTGTTVKGMFNNCGGGSTPWGNVLTAEENFDQYFANRGAVVPAGDPLKQYAVDNASVFGIPAAASGRGFETVDPRFDMVQEWNEPFRFGWVVEVDPYDPTSTPKKRTALGRFKHEAASGAYDASGRWVIYMGDDQAGQYVYKFVTANAVNTADRAANADLLDTGTLYVATFNADGTGTWSPLVYGSVPNPPAPALAFEDQADVLIRARTAATALGATPMDRPEDIDVSPVSGDVFIAMTGTSRAAATPANPRVSNAATDPNSSRGGHVIQLHETAGQAGTTFTWEIFLLCGTPGVGGTLDATTFPAGANASGRTYYGGFDETQVSPITRPDNLAFDSQGNLWITTDGQPSAASGGGLGLNDTAYGVPVTGAERGHLKALVSAVPGAEMTGPYLTPDDRTLFLAIQHPGEDGSIALPQSVWNAVSPAGGGTCSRNAVLAVRRLNQTAIGYGTDGPTPVVPEFPSSIAMAAGASAAVVGGLIALRNRRPNVGHDPAV
jgi:uncharacterized protein